MTKLRCCFCQQELERDGDQIQCPDINCRHKHDWYGSYALWHELIRTRKALDVAVDALDAGKTLADIAGFKMLVAGLEKALDKIKTALEQKD